ncbi:MAG: signal peptidase I [Armatimonadota bacterium]
MPESAQPRRRARGLRLLVRVAVPVLFAASLTYVFTRVIRFGYVVSSSMEPALQVGDFYIVRLDAYRDGSQPRRGDVVVYAGPDDEPYVKRVVGLGGELLWLVGGRVWLADGWLREPYVKELPSPDWPVLVRVPEGSVFVLGDNRNLSEDSRDHGPVPLSRLLGRATRVVWPLGHLKVLADVDYQ